ncbi:MAG TPA: tetratricopeptide repeat protein [Solirubrobacteraceae bacterium]|nr:tetratricopeptide repeat protein [Solirubrobacteraceae bacterium]
MEPREGVYDLFRRGSDLLEHGHNHQALIPLKQAAALSPDSASIREAYGRALFHVQHYQEAADEFRAVTDREPTNDYALFCLGRCLQQLGRHAEARPPLTLAARLAPGRSDYRMYAERARLATGPDAPNPYAPDGEPPPTRS